MSTPPTSGPVLPPELDPRGPRGPRRTVPPPPGPPVPRRRLARTLSWLAVVGSVLVLLVSVTGYALFVHYDGNISRLPIFNHNKAAVDGKGVNYLIVGSDTRALPGDAKYQASPGSADYVTGERSDTVMLVHIPGGKTARATVVSFPRDTFVQIPAYADKRGHHDAQFAKLNAAFAFGGPALLVQTIEGLTGLRVDHYVQVDFSGFKNMVNSLGGVTVCIGTSRNDKDSGDFLSKGVHHINGDQALAFVRDRKGLPNGDFDRIRDQQYFLSVVMHKVLSAGTLSQPWKINSFLNSVTKSLTADQELSFSDMRNLALRMRNLDPSRVEFLTLPNLGDAMRPPYGSVVLVNQTKAKTLFDRLRTDQTATPKKTKQPKLTVEPSAVQVTVRNGSGVGGRAVEVRNALRDQGFVTLGAQNADRSDYEHSVVRYAPDKKQSAETLAAAVPGATLEEDSSLGSSLVLIVGGDYSGVQAVHVGSSTSTSTSTSTATKKPATTAPKPTEPTVNGSNMSCAP